MTFATLALPNQTDAIRAYLGNVSRAGRAFFAALLTLKPQPSSLSLESRDEAMMEREKSKSISLLNSMARQHDALMPNFSAELRYLASRG